MGASAGPTGAGSCPASVRPGSPGGRPAAAPGGQRGEGQREAVRRCAGPRSVRDRSRIDGKRRELTRGKTAGQARFKGGLDLVVTVSRPVGGILSSAVRRLGG